MIATRNVCEAILSDPLVKPDDSAVADACKILAGKTRAEDTPEMKTLARASGILQASLQTAKRAIADKAGLPLFDTIDLKVTGNG